MDPIRQAILDELNWKTSARFTTSELQIILAVGRDIRAFVETLLPGVGTEWMKRNLGKIRLHSGGLLQWVVSIFNHAPTSVVFPVRDVWLIRPVDAYAQAKQHVAHEIGHVLDNRSGGWLPAIWAGRGFGDLLTAFVGGQPKGLRWTNGACGVPPSCCWTVPGNATECGDLSTADYFAEAFTWTIYDPGRCPHPGMVGWMKQRIMGLA